MKTSDIRTSADDLHGSCDVCGRTLLRGEQSHPYLEGGTRRTVCELCTGRAQNEGWLREGAAPVYDGREGSSHRAGPLRRLRRRLAAASEPEPEEQAAEEPAMAPQRAPSERPRPTRAERPRQSHTDRLRPSGGETRHVRAIPTSLEQRLATAVEAFNASEHPRTVAGIARSLGLPSVSVRPADSSPGTIRILAAWELCWYRYEVDLRDDPGMVRPAGQGSELEELEPGELEANALADEAGGLTLGA